MHWPNSTIHTGLSMHDRLHFILLKSIRKTPPLSEIKSVWNLKAANYLIIVNHISFTWWLKHSSAFRSDFLTTLSASAVRSRPPKKAEERTIPFQGRLTVEIYLQFDARWRPLFDIQTGTSAVFFKTPWTQHCFFFSFFLGRIACFHLLFWLWFYRLLIVHSRFNTIALELSNSVR